MASKCTKCGNTAYYNFTLNIGLCDICIGEKLERQAERIKRLEADLKIKQSVCETIEKEVTAINKELEAEIKRRKYHTKNALHYYKINKPKEMMGAFEQALKVSESGVADGEDIHTKSR